ncbi:hypothetical protein [Xanthobacter versatilis]|uniref:hypothetical protein n=1 Tax=Xanthobacter autotrophicus (strain ATCC BAA-1158 / Py2) TaxID=78245 RepID=UPI00372863A5
MMGSDGMMGGSGMMWSMGLFDGLVLLTFAIAALIKYAQLAEKACRHLRHGGRAPAGARADCASPRDSILTQIKAFFLQRHSKVFFGSA